MKILLIAYYYPPISSGGTERPLKMVKYLPRFGHNVTVLTHSYKKNVKYCSSEIRIYDASHNKNRVGKYKLFWAGLRGLVELQNRCGKYASIYAWWKKAVCEHAEYILAQSACDAILATYPPVENLEIGLYLAERFQLPLTVDFRDGLLYEPIEVRPRHYPCIAHEYARIEGKIARAASLLITAFPRLTEYFVQRYGCRNVITIPNGWDAEDFADISERVPLDPVTFNIVHTGSIRSSYADRDIAPFVNALNRLVREHPHLQQRVRLHLVGRMERQELALMRHLLDSKVVVYHNKVPHEVALAFQVKADALLLVTSLQRKGAVPGKLFEYLYAGNPILALTSHSYAEEIITATGSGWAVPPDNIEQIEQLLYALLTNPALSHALTPSEHAIAQFSRAHQMKILSQRLQTMAENLNNS